ncbi:4'-phosphopantetheinyl transferase superfamily protein [Dyella sp. M7H15-1]|uniref:4'-phosphopantetheinyl transferase family protein n=1 Tax=Dyella sp. M7H15-1 TaxID=2501295 RepID=UPI0013E8E21B|nr:4'-phosphopantetheinyl transferase superfamily protein [Dyella sp. M7H15-1]
MDVVDLYDWPSAGSEPAYAMVRAIAGKTLGLPLDRVPLIRPPRRAPRIDLPDCPIRFSLSHCQQRLLLAVTLFRDIGIDIEPSQRAIDIDALANCFMSKQERRQYAEAPSATRHVQGLQWWTRKEALAKATGLGLDLPLRQFPLPASPAPIDVVANGPDAPYRIADLDMGPDYLASVACQSDASFTVRWTQAYAY